MTDYTDPESPIADPHAVERLQWKPNRKWKPDRGQAPWYDCVHCGLEQRQHINRKYCPEWRLRQLDGDR